VSDSKQSWKEKQTHIPNNARKHIKCRRLDRSIVVGQDGFRNSPKNCNRPDEQSVVGGFESKWIPHLLRGTISDYTFVAA
jgi:hypothetical protein